MSSFLFRLSTRPRVGSRLRGYQQVAAIVEQFITEPVTELMDVEITHHLVQLGMNSFGSGLHTYEEASIAQCSVLTLIGLPATSQGWIFSISEGSLLFPYFRRSTATLECVTYNDIRTDDSVDGTWRCKLKDNGRRICCFVIRPKILIILESRPLPVQSHVSDIDRILGCQWGAPLIFET